MTIYILLPLLVCIFGLFVMFACAPNKNPPGNPVAYEAARGAWWMGLLVTLFVVATHIIKL